MQESILEVEFFLQKVLFTDYSNAAFSNFNYALNSVDCSMMSLSQRFNLSHVSFYSENSDI